MDAHTGFKGNQQALPRKLCTACGREMVWRSAWARHWVEVKFCSDACRRRRTAVPAR